MFALFIVGLVASFLTGYMLGFRNGGTQALDEIQGVFKRNEGEINASQKSSK